MSDDPVDLESFVAQLLNPRWQPAPFGQQTKNTPGASGQLSGAFEDVEGELDRIFRLSTSMDSYFRWLMTDPYTVHRWRSAWLKFCGIFLANPEQYDATKKAFLSVRLINCLEACLTQDKEYACRWLAEDHTFCDSLRTLFEAASHSPDLAAPFVTDCLAPR